ncbi:MAG TPA: LuxR C-terminal-related transcriptional regulator [Acidimicrobiales bacterium]|nr:LuxR C-terminal-related transcriptional regulator [Acidimicrobiales bacterium]
MEWPLTGRETELARAIGLVRSGTGVAILGPTGVGKSRLLHTVLDRVAAERLSVVRVAASASTRSIPFAPFVELLPHGRTPDRLSMLRDVLAALDRRATPHGIVLAVDDAHQLDAGSLALVLAVVAARSATVCLTARTGDPMDADLVGLWTNGVIERVDIEPLGEARTRALAASVLGPHRDELADELWRISAGNPLVLHEVIEGAVGRSIERGADGTWERTGPLARSDRLSDLVDSRLRALTSHLRTAMETVAVASPAPFDLLQRATGGGLAELERRGFVAPEPGDPASAVVAHPLYGEVLEANLPAARRRAANRRLAESALRSDDRIDPVRAAVWQLDSGETTSAELAIVGAAAALARHDPHLAERLVEPLDATDDRVGLLLGQALSHQQRYDDAEMILAGRHPVDPELTGAIASARAQNLAFGLARIDEARALLADAAGSVSDHDLRGRLNNERAMVSAIHGDFVDAMRASDEVLSDPLTSTVARATAYVTRTVALAMTGDCDGLDAIIDDAIATADAASPELPFAPDQVRAMLMISRLNAGRIGTGITIIDTAVAGAAPGDVFTPTWLSGSALARNLSGELARAADHARRALDLYARADPFGLEAQSRGALALALAQMGDVDAGRSIDDTDLPVPAPRLAVWVDRGRAWTAAAQGRVDEALGILIAGGRSAIAAQHVAWGALCLHDAVRLGRPDLAVDDLRSIDASRGAHLLRALCAHAEAATADDLDGLAAVAERFAEMGAWLYAAEAWADAATRLDHRDDGPSAARAAALSLTAELACERPDTPLVRDRPPLVSRRELEVAREAARGAPSADIARGLFISVRTADNHLRSVYRKLGVGGRSELATVLEPALRPRLE